MIIELKTHGDKTYKVAGGTYYHHETEDEAIRVLENCRINHTRVMVAYGNKDTGKEWERYSDNDVFHAGYVSRSMGPVKIPLLIHNSRSMGGPGMLESSILSIKESKGKRVLYTYKKE